MSVAGHCRRDRQEGENDGRVLPRSTGQSKSRKATEKVTRIQHKARNRTRTQWRFSAWERRFRRGDESVSGDEAERRGAKRIEEIPKTPPTQEKQARNATEKEKTVLIIYIIHYLSWRQSAEDNSSTGTRSFS